MSIERRTNAFLVPLLGVLVLGAATAFVRTQGEFWFRVGLVSTSWTMGIARTLVAAIAVLAVASIAPLGWSSLNSLRVLFSMRRGRRPVPAFPALFGLGIVVSLFGSLVLALCGKWEHYVIPGNVMSIGLVHLVLAMAWMPLLVWLALTGTLFVVDLPRSIAFQLERRPTGAVRLPGLREIGLTLAEIGVGLGVLDGVRWLLYWLTAPKRDLGLGLSPETSVLWRNLVWGWSWSSQFLPQRVVPVILDRFIDLEIAALAWILGAAVWAVLRYGFRLQSRPQLERARIHVECALSLVVVFLLVAALAWAGARPLWNEPVWQGVRSGGDWPQWRLQVGPYGIAVLLAVLDAAAFVVLRSAWRGPKRRAAREREPEEQLSVGS
jgi:hypothetical protein